MSERDAILLIDGDLVRSVRAKKGSHIDARSELRPTTNWRTTGVDLAPPLVYWRDSHVDVAIDNFLL